MMSGLGGLVDGMLMASVLQGKVEATELDVEVAIHNY